MKYYKEFLDKYSNIEVVFDCFRHGRFEYIGECAGVTVRAITSYMYDLDDFVVQADQKVKIKDIGLLETVDGIEIDQLLMNE